METPLIMEVDDEICTNNIAKQNIGLKRGGRGIRNLLKYV